MQCLGCWVLATVLMLELAFCHQENFVHFSAQCLLELCKGRVDFDDNTFTNFKSRGCSGGNMKEGLV